MNDRVVDAQVALGSAAAKVQRQGRLAAGPFLWVGTLIGAVAMILLTVFEGGGDNTWVWPVITVLLLTQCTGPTVSAVGGPPRPGAGPRGYVWLVVTVVVLGLTWHHIHLSGKHLVGSTVLVLLMALVAWALDRGRVGKALAEQWDSRPPASQTRFWRAPVQNEWGEFERDRRRDFIRNIRWTRLIVGLLVFQFAFTAPSGSWLLRGLLGVFALVPIVTAFTHAKRPGTHHNWKAVLGIGVLVYVVLWLTHRLGEFGAALSLVIVAGIYSTLGAVIGGPTGLGAWAAAIALLAGNVIGGRFAVWFPAGGAEKRREVRGIRSAAGHRVAAIPGIRAPQNLDEEILGADFVASRPSLYLANLPGLPSEGLLTGYGDGQVFPDRVSPFLAVVAQSGAGKTRRIIAPNVLVHEGPVVTTSTKDDLAKYTTAVRRQRSPKSTVWWWDPAGSLPVPDGAQVARWSPLSLVVDRDTATSTALALSEAGSISSGRGSDSSRFFADQATELLAPLMYAAVLAKGGTDGGMSLLMSWITLGPTYEGEGSWQEAVTALSEAGEILLSRQLAHAIEESKGAAEKRVSDTIATIRQVLAPFRRERIVLEADAPTFDARAFAMSEADTLHIAMTGDEQKALGPLVALLLNAIGNARRRMPEAQRNERPMLWALDELARVPLPNLEEVLGEGRGSMGLRLVAGLQSYGQLEAWPNGRAMRNLFPWTVIFRNTGDTDLLKEVSEFGGEQIVYRESYSQSAASTGQRMLNDAIHGTARPHDPTRSVSEQTERVLKINEVAGMLRDGEIRLIEGRADRGVLYAPDIDEAPWEPMWQACEDQMLVDLREKAPAVVVPEPRVGDDQMEEVQPLD